MSRKLVLIGGGGHCKSVADSVRSCKLYSDVVITDCSLSVEKRINEYPVVGDDNMLSKLYESGYREAFIAIGSIEDNNRRREAYKTAEAIGFSFPNIIDPCASIANESRLTRGGFVGKNTVINSGSTIEQFAIINTGAIIEHDCYIEEFSHISVGAVICGGCHIGKDVFVGAHATVIQGIHVDDKAVLGAGCLVLADVPSGTLVTGVYKGI